MEKYLFNEKTGVICKEGTSENDIIVLGKIIEQENKFILNVIRDNGEKIIAELSVEDYFNGKEFVVKQKTNKQSLASNLDTDLIIEVGQHISDGHLISFEKKENIIEFLIDTEEYGEKTVKCTVEEVLRLAKKYNMIKTKELKLINKDGKIMEFNSINDFYSHLLLETKKEKINKGLLYNLKNGKSKSCYGYKLTEEEK